MYVQLLIQLVHVITIASSLHGGQPVPIRRILWPPAEWRFRNSAVHVALERAGAAGASSCGGPGASRWIAGYQHTRQRSEFGVPLLFTHGVTGAACFLPVLGLMIAVMVLKSACETVSRRHPQRQRILDALQARCDALPPLSEEERTEFVRRGGAGLHLHLNPIFPAPWSTELLSRRYALDYAVAHVRALSLYSLPTWRRLILLIAVTTLVNVLTQMAFNDAVLLYRGHNYFAIMRMEYQLHSSTCYFRSLQAGVRQTVLSFLSHF